MAFISGSPLTNDLQTILQADELRPGDAPSYQLCKTILSFHPLGAKLVDAPTKLAMSQRREITVSKGPEERVRKAFEDEWAKLDINAQIENLMRISRAYGIGSVAVMVEGEDPEKEIKLQDIWKKNIS